MLFTEPVPIRPDDPNAAFLYNAYLQELYHKAQFLRLTQRSGTIQNGDKVGNLDAKWIVFTSNAVANTEDAISHTLGRVPTIIIPTLPDKSSVLYDSTTPHTRTTLYLKSSAASTAWTILIA